MRNEELIIPRHFYQGNDVVSIARRLLGKYLFTSIDGLVSGGYIVETEAYNGAVDRASHAYGNRLTPRTSTMFKEGGIAYVYLCYGIHEMLNIVTSSAGEPHAVLIRAVNPIVGINIMLARRNMAVIKPNITMGPGSVARALGISRKMNGFLLDSGQLWLEDHALEFADDEVAAVPRIGVDYAGNDALLPYRFYVKGNPYVSRPVKEIKKNQ